MQFNAEHSWTAVVVTCCSLDWANAIQTELLLLRKKGFFSKLTILLSVEDPENGVGSGGATLNALLVVVDFLSAKYGFNVLTSNVLYNSQILIIHNGRSSVYAPCGKAFMQIPSKAAFECETNLENLVQFVNRVASNIGDRKGVWVCSTDMLLNEISPSSAQIALVPSSPKCVIFCALSTPEDGTNHGVVKFGIDQMITNIHYRQSFDIVSSCALPSYEGRVPIVMGLVYMSPDFSESLLLLHYSAEAILSCTHLGADSGSEPIQVSLFFDMLAASASEVSQEEFVEGFCSQTYELQNNYRANSVKMKRQFRQLMWQGLNDYRCYAVLLPDVKYAYLWNQMNLLNYQNVLLSRSLKSNVIMNSSIEGLDENTISGTVIQNCTLNSHHSFPLLIENNVFLSDLVINTEELKTEVKFKKDMAYLQMECCLPQLDDSEPVFIFFGMTDELFLPFQDSKATFCNQPWSEFFNWAKVKENEIWPDLQINDQNLFNAALFTAGVTSTKVLEWLNLRKEAPSWWLSRDRLSIKNILNNIHLKNEFKSRRKSSLNAAVTLSKRILKDSADGALIHTFKIGVAEGWHLSLLNALDNVAVDVSSSNKLARVLANIADLLGCMTKGNGGIRSGPAANKEWETALAYFEKKDSNSIINGINELKKVRAEWVTDPRRIIRAARHYEGAIQSLIRRNVLTADSFTSLSTGSLPPFDKWITCECPARIDLYGGWTDTPPICYELGGSVVNAAILVNGKKPIGAKVKRTSIPEITIFMDNEITLKLETLSHLSDYNQPLSEGALVKACLICANIATLDVNETLKEQLEAKFSGGFHIETWSDLPKGSGLGTSSILAAAIMACLWTASGKVYTRSSVIHAVLCVEQMLTTGGGWQDQVGGVMGGVVHGESLPGLPLQVKARRIKLRPEVTQVFRSKLFLIYTGKVRLAKNLLQEVLRNWFARDSKIYSTFTCLLNHSFEFIHALENGDFPLVGELMNEYWSLKKILAAGAEPPFVSDLMKELQPLLHGQLLCGAGGGGFMVALTKDNVSKKHLQDNLQMATMTRMEIYAVDLDEEGLKVTVGSERLEIE